MKVPEEIAMSIPPRLLPLAQEVIDDAPDCSFEECLAHWSIVPTERLRESLTNHPLESAACQTAVREMLDFASLVQFTARAAA